MAEAEPDSVAFEEAMGRTGGFGKYQKMLLIITLPIGFSFVFGVSSMGYIMPAIVCEFHISKYEQGLIYSAVYCGMVICGTLWGIAADVLGRRNTLIITCSLTGTFDFLSMLSTRYWHLLLCKFISGCTLSGIHLTYYVYLSEFVDAKFKDSMTVRTGGAAAFGYFLMPLVASFLLPLNFKINIIENYVFLNSWKAFLIFASSAPILGAFISIFLLNETPKYLSVHNRKEDALRILRDIYAQNVNMPKESYSVRNLIVETEEHKTDVDPNIRRNVIVRAINYLKPLFSYPYFIPAMMAFAAQFVTMGSYNTIRQYQPILFALELGIGQYDVSKNMTTVRSNHTENVPFCVLFETQNLFAARTTCDQDEVYLDPRIYLCAAFSGFMIFLSFFLFRVAVSRVGKELVLLLSNIVCAVVIALFPFSVAIFGVIILTIYSVCLQNCIALSIGLMIGRVPVSIRGFTISLIMVIGRVGVIFGNQVLPFVTNLSCYIGFWSIACLNLLMIPIIFIYLKQPNPYEEAALKAAEKSN